MSEVPLVGFDAEDPEAWIVLADWLTQRGDPRGTMLSLAAGLASGEAPASAADELAQLRRRHLPRYTDELVEVFGVADAAALRRELDGAWREGVLHRARLLRPRELDEAGVRRRVEGLLGSEAACALSVLRLDTFAPTSALAAVVASPRPTIRCLTLGNYVRPLGKLAALEPALPGLRELELLGPGIELEHWPRLTRLRLCCELDLRPLSTLATGTWPQLRRLELRLGGDDYLRVCGSLIALFESWAEGRSAPALEHLAVHGVELSDVVIERLSSGSLAAQLRSLDLSDNDVPGDLASLPDPARFWRVEQLSIVGSSFTDAQRDKLRVTWGGRLVA